MSDRLPQRPADFKGYAAEREKVVAAREAGGDPEVEAAWTEIKAGIERLVVLAVVNPQTADERRVQERMRKLVEESMDQITRETGEPLPVELKWVLQDGSLDLPAELGATLRQTALQIAIVENMRFSWDRLD